LSSHASMLPRTRLNTGALAECIVRLMDRVSSCG
jgi:hypothetical protein